MYHISLRKLTPKACLFTPRIPETAGASENKTIPRICVSETIDGSIQAIASCHIHEALTRCRDTQCDELLLYVYTPEVMPSSEVVVTASELKARGYVRDVDDTKEWWLLTPTTMTLHSVLRVTNVRESFDYLHFADFGLVEFPYQVQCEAVEQAKIS